MLLIFALSFGFVWHQVRAQKPDVILAQLRDGKGDREKLLMKLQLSRGDVTGKIIDAYTAPDAPDAFRTDLIELLFRRHRREPDTRGGETMRKALKDNDVAVRRRAAYCMGAYADVELMKSLTECVDDADPEVRRHAYLVLIAHRGPGSRLWDHFMSDEERNAAVQICLKQRETETDPALVYFAQSVVGRAIDRRLRESREALQSGDLHRAEDLINQALELDPSNKQAHIRHARFYLAQDDKEKAKEIAAKHGALLTIPKLEVAPVIDGDPTEAAWDQAARVDPKYHTTSQWTEKLCEGKTEAFVGYRDGIVYIAERGYEDDLGQLSTTQTARDGPVWEDDCVELFLGPPNDEKHVYQFIINSIGTMMDNYGRDAKVNVPCEVQAKVYPDRGYWAVEFAVKAKDLDAAEITSESLWSVNFVRARIGLAAEHCQYWPTFGGALKYHLFPMAVFADAPAPQPKPQSD